MEDRCRGKQVGLGKSKVKCSPFHLPLASGKREHGHCRGFGREEEAGKSCLRITFTS